MFLIFDRHVVGIRAILDYERRPSNAAGADAGLPAAGSTCCAVPSRSAEPDRAPRVIWPLAIGIGGVIAAAIAIAVHRSSAAADDPTRSRPSS